MATKWLRLYLSTLFALAFTSLCGFHAHTGKYLKVLQGALPHAAVVSTVHSQRQNLFIDRCVVKELNHKRKRKKKGGGVNNNFPEILLWLITIFFCKWKAYLLLVRVFSPLTGMYPNIPDLKSRHTATLLKTQNKGWMQISKQKRKEIKELIIMIFRGHDRTIYKWDHERNSQSALLFCLFVFTNEYYALRSDHEDIFACCYYGIIG